MKIIRLGGGGFVVVYMWLCAYSAVAASVNLEYCADLTSKVSVFLKHKALGLDGNQVPEDQIDNILVADLRQKTSDGRLKRIEPVLIDDEILVCFGKQGRELVLLSNAISNQRARLQAMRRSNEQCLFGAKLW